METKLLHEATYPFHSISHQWKPSLTFTSPDCLKTRRTFPISKIEPPKPTTKIAGAKKRSERETMNLNDENPPSKFPKDEEATTRLRLQEGLAQRNDEMENAARAVEILEESSGVVVDKVSYHKISRAVELFDKMMMMSGNGCSCSTPNRKSYNILIYGFCKNKKMKRAMEYLDRMVSFGHRPDIVMYNTLISGLCRIGKVEDAMSLLNQLSDSSCSPNLLTYNVMILGLSKAGMTECGIQLLAEMERKGIKPDHWTFIALVPGLAREGKLDHPSVPFEDLEELLGVTSNKRTYDSAMYGLCQSGQTARAIDFLGYMVRKGLKPDDFSFRTIIEGIAAEGLIAEARELLDMLVVRGFVNKNWQI
ncbi:Pentatricopeptide repeat-containing protein [Drosera capensis]